MRMLLWKLVDVALFLPMREGLNTYPLEVTTPSTHPPTPHARPLPASPHQQHALTITPFLHASQTVYARRHVEPAVVLLSEFMSCARVLNGALRLNPWDTPAVAQAMYRALQMELSERTARRAAFSRPSAFTHSPACVDPPTVSASLPGVIAISSSSARTPRPRGRSDSSVICSPRSRSSSTRSVSSSGSRWDSASPASVVPRGGSTTRRLIRRTSSQRIAARAAAPSSSTGAVRVPPFGEFPLA